MLIALVADLLEGSEIIIVPDPCFYHVPFPALHDDSRKCSSETFRIRIVPSLTTLKCIQDSPTDYHSQTGVLIVVDPRPEVGRVRYNGRRTTFTPLCKKVGRADWPTAERSAFVRRENNQYVSLRISLLVSCTTYE